MGCTRCGPDTKLIELMFTKLVQEALKDGTLQAGLVDCSEKRLEKNTNVVTCNALEDLVCDLIKDGKVCINEPIALHHNAETGELSIGMSNGEVITTTLTTVDIFLKSAVRDGENLVFTTGVADDTKADQTITIAIGDLVETTVGDGLQGDGTATSPVSIKLDPASSDALTVGAEGLKLDADSLKPIATVELVDLFGERIGYALTETERRAS